MKQKIVFAMLMGIITTGIVSFTLIWVNLGFTPAYVGTWLQSWAIAYVVVIPIILIVSPKVQRIANDLSKERTYATQANTVRKGRCGVLLMNERAAVIDGNRGGTNFSDLR